MALATAVLFSGSTPSSGYWRRFAAWSVDGVRPSSSILDGADLTGASLDGVDLTRADLEGANLSDIAYDAYTRWPDGFRPLADCTSFVPPRPGTSPKFSTQITKHSSGRTTSRPKRTATRPTSYAA